MTNDSILRGASSEHTPPHPEPDCQPPSDGGLLPCPFCGGEAKLYEVREGWEVTCLGCRPETAKFGLYKGMAIKLWNTRANPPTPEPDELEPIEKIAPTEIEISGPYHYDGEKHPCLRLDAPERIVGVVYIVGDDKERAFAEAQTIKEAFRLGGKEIDRIHYASANPPTPKPDTYLRQTVRDAIDALERNSTSAPVVECLKAALATPTPEGDFVLVPREALGWLFGENADKDGKWFDPETCGASKFRDKYTRYWWRSHFRKLIAAAPNPPMGGEDR